MMVRARFFASTFMRQYATGSPEHLRLQAELSNLLQVYRETKVTLASIPLVENDLVEFKRHCGALINYIEPKKQVAYRKLIIEATESLEQLQHFQKKNENKKGDISEKILKILNEIKSECEDTASIAAAPLKR